MIADGIVFAPIAGSAPCTAADFIALLELVAGRNGVPADLPAFIATFPADQVDNELRVRGIADTAQLMFVRHQAAALKHDAARGRKFLQTQRENALKGVEKARERKSYDPDEFVRTYEEFRPKYLSDKAALLAVAEHLGTPCGDGDEDQQYRNLRDRLKRARGYVGPGSTNVQAD